MISSCFFIKEFFLAKQKYNIHKKIQITIVALLKI